MADAKMNKTQAVLLHLQKYGSITSWEAIQLYRATRLSAIIFNLIRRNYHIVSEWCEGTDSFGNKSRWVKYILLRDDGLG